MAQLTSVRGSSDREIHILLINPNSTSSMTDNCLQSVAPKLPANVVVSGFTAPKPSPSAVEGQVDGVLSTGACLRALLPVVKDFDGFLVACFSAHPLITALREEVTQPVMGIMEAALYASRICGSRLSVLTTSPRSKIMHDNAIWDYGLSKYSAGCESVNISVLDLEALPEHEVNSRMAETAKRLVDERGADCISLGCAGMTLMQKACADAVGMDRREVMMVDGVGVGVHFLVALVREGLGTAKGGLYSSASAGRQARKQDWY
jgi:Asp/Glu/hydantoin racemase